MSSASRAIVPTSRHRTCALAGRAIVGLTSPTFMERFRVVIPASPLCCPATSRGESSPAAMHFHRGAHDQNLPGIPIRGDRPGRVLSRSPKGAGGLCLTGSHKGSMALLAERDPEEARKLLDPVLERMMEVVHRYEGTVNQVMGDGIMVLFGAPLAHEDHAVRACYAALDMHTAIRRHAEEARRAHPRRSMKLVGSSRASAAV